MDDYVITVLSNIGMISFIALSAYLLLVTGEISFGQQAYFGLGAYAAGAVTAMLGLPIWAGILIGASGAGLMAMVVGALTLRLSGLYFSIATLAFAEMVRLDPADRRGAGRGRRRDGGPGRRERIPRHQVDVRA